MSRLSETLGCGDFVAPHKELCVRLLKFGLFEAVEIQVKHENIAK